LTSKLRPAEKILIVVVIACFLLLFIIPRFLTGLAFLLAVTVAFVYSLTRMRHPQHQTPGHGNDAVPAGALVELPPQAAETSPFEKAVAQFGVKAERFSVTKVLDENGTSVFQFELEGLEVTQGELVGLHFVMASVAGYVTRPKVQAGKHLVEWHDDSDCRKNFLPIDKAVECVRRLSGVFRFDPLRRNNPPLTFGWVCTVLNSDALTKYQFEQLYGNEKVEQPTFPDVPGQSEYFARVAWFPVESFCVTITLPPRLKEKPFLKVEALKGRIDIPEEAVVFDSILQSFPRGESEWVKSYVKWERDWNAQSQMRPLQQPQPGTYRLEVDKPPAGSRFTLGWGLGQTEQAQEFEYLVGRSQEIRERLLSHAHDRKRGKKGPGVEEIQQLFKKFDEEVRGQYALEPDREQFTVTLMTYDQTRRRLVMVESLVNGQEPQDTSWDFSLPFGFGLAGACFKEGSKAFMYLQSEDKDEDDAKYYLPVQGSGPYQILLALPVDHPDFTEPTPGNGARGVERSRQLIGIVSIGSTCPATKLHEFAIEAAKGSEATEEPGGDKPSAEAQKIQQLRIKCQKLGDDICAAVLHGK
jgi:hypothetical protein